MELVKFHFVKGIPHPDPYESHNSVDAVGMQIDVDGWNHMAWSDQDYSSMRKIHVSFNFSLEKNPAIEKISKDPAVEIFCIFPPVVFMLFNGLTLVHDG